MALHRIKHFLFILQAIALIGLISQATAGCPSAVSNCHDDSLCRLQYIMHIFPVSQSSAGKLILTFDGKNPLCICNKTENLNFRKDVKDIMKNFIDRPIEQLKYPPQGKVLDDVITKCLTKIKELARSRGLVHDICNNAKIAINYDRKVNFIYPTGNFSYPTGAAVLSEPYGWTLHFSLAPPYFLSNPASLSLPFPCAGRALQEKGNNLSLCKNIASRSLINNTFERPTFVGMMQLRNLPPACYVHLKDISSNITGIMNKWEGPMTETLTNSPFDTVKLREVQKNTFIDIKKVLPQLRGYLINNEVVDDIKFSEVTHSNNTFSRRASSKHPFELSLTFKWAAPQTHENQETSKA